MTVAELIKELSKLESQNKEVLGWKPGARYNISAPVEFPSYVMLELNQTET